MDYTIFINLVQAIIAIAIFLMSNNLDNLGIPNNEGRFKEEYGHNLKKILDNNLENCSHFLENIITNKVVSDNEEQQFNLIETHNSFFISLKRNIKFFNYKKEVHDLYLELFNKRRKIKNLFIILVVIIVIFIILSFYINSNFSTISVSVPIYILFEIIKEYLEFKKIPDKINKIIEMINHEYESIPNTIVDKYG